jgi:hypothetical protein
MVGAMVGAAVVVVGTVVAVVVVVAGGVEQEAVEPAMLCLGGCLAVLRALLLWVSCSERSLAHDRTMRLMGVDVVIIKLHRNILTYSYVPPLTSIIRRQMHIRKDPTAAFPDMELAQQMTECLDPLANTGILHRIGNAAKRQLLANTSL